MLPMLLAAGAQAAGSILGGIFQAGAYDDAKDAQQGAAQQAMHAAQRATNAATQMYAPGVATYAPSLTALAQRLGLPADTVSAIGSSGSGGKKIVGGFDPAYYAEKYPDVVAEYKRLSPNNLKNNLGVTDLNGFLQWHWNQSGQYENGRYPNAASEQATQQAQAAPAPSPTAGAGTSAPTNNLTGSFGNTADPKWTAPADFSFSVESFVNNPAYKFAQEQGSGQVMANASATGALQSGAALKALQDRGQKTAYQWYAPERDAAYGRWVDGYKMKRGEYESDRNYLTQRYDRATDDLFRFATIGQNAVSSSANAQLGQGATDARTLEGMGDSTAANALAQGNIWGGILGDLGGIASGVINGWGNGSGSAGKTGTSRTGTTKNTRY